jgi:hypothetical protein
MNYNISYNSEINFNKFIQIWTKIDSKEITNHLI